MRNIISDCHMHTAFSADSKTDPKLMIEQAISQRLKAITITDHYDYDFPKEYELDFTFDIPNYYSRINELKTKYADKIELLIGVEIGLQPHIAQEIDLLVKQANFDFVIGSTHIVNKKDPYYEEFWLNRPTKAAYEAYFKSMLESIKSCNNYDVYGHIDYIARYGPKNSYRYLDYTDIIDIILKNIINNGKGIEINSAGFKHATNAPNPSYDILKRYKELGGEILTIGSDAHSPEYIAYHFEDVEEIIRSVGFNSYAIFRNRKPEFIKL